MTSLTHFYTVLLMRYLIWHGRVIYCWNERLRGSRHTHISGPWVSVTSTEEIDGEVWFLRGSFNFRQRATINLYQVCPVERVRELSFWRQKKHEYVVNDGMNKWDGRRLGGNMLSRSKQKWCIPGWNQGFRITELTASILLIYANICFSIRHLH